jgi:acetyltransferase-like isoleucine patch superfamily enzyme
LNGGAAYSLTAKDPTELDRQKILEALKDEKLEELFLLVSRLKDSLGSATTEQLNRSLPFADLMFDRWDRARSLGFGEGTSVYDSCCIFGKITVGKNTWIGPFTVLDGSGGLEIGGNCSISSGVQIYSHDSVEWAVSGGEKPYLYAPTRIGSNCYIGPNTIISKGVELGDGCVVGANSYVNKSYPAGSRIAGSPARLLNQ